MGQEFSAMDLVVTIIDSPVTKWLLLIMLFVMPVASLLTWAERRQSAMMQDRRGPNRANIGPIKLLGILHFVADAIKMIGKEDYVPPSAHRGLYTLAPIIAIVPVFIAFAIIPFGPTIYVDSLFDVLNLYELRTEGPPADARTIDLQIFEVEFGLIFYFAILTLANYGATIAGWASYNKWALLGGLRASSQMMSYEVSMGLSLVAVFLVMGTLEPGAMVDWQGANPLNWGWALGIHEGWPVPIGLVALVIFFTAAIAETKRGPFDLPEGESEIVGYFVEYSGMRWGIFFLAEFVEIVFIAMVVTTVFFGGYHVPFLYADGFHFAGWVAYLPHIAVVGLQILAFGLKVVFFCWLQLAIRWTLPRFRPDQLMQLGWMRLLPFALVNIMVAALVSLWW
jgi:NADH-quinone oxidoreductase subunit H